MRGRPPRRCCAWAPRHSNCSRHARRGARGRGVVGDPSSPWWGTRPARQRRESIQTARESLWMSNRRYLHSGIFANRVSLILVQIIFCHQPSIVQPSPVPNTHIKPILRERTYKYLNFEPIWVIFRGLDMGTKVWSTLLQFCEPSGFGLFLKRYSTV